jgi:hypothetical protein
MEGERKSTIKQPVCPISGPRIEPGISQIQKKEWDIRSQHFILSKLSI